MVGIPANLRRKLRGKSGLRQGGGGGGGGVGRGRGRGRGGGLIGASGRLHQVELSADESGFSSSYKGIGFDTLGTGDHLGDQGLTLSSGIVTIPESARQGKTLWRVMGHVFSNDSAAGYCTLRLQVNFDGTGTQAIIHQSRHSLGSLFRWAVASPWMPFETANCTVNFVERSDSGAHSILASDGTYGKSLLQVEML